MPLHRLTEIVLGVPNLEATAEYYTEFGLIPEVSADRSEYRFSTTDGGQQMRLVHAPMRRLLSLGLGVDDSDDLDRIGRQLDRLGVEYRKSDNRLDTVEPATQLPVVVTVASHLVQVPTPAPAPNAPGAIARPGLRAPAIYRTDPVRPRKLGHIVVGTTDLNTSQAFFTEGIGFKVTDIVLGFGVFLRCTPDHHNLLLQHAPVSFLHHTSWEVNDIDEIGQGAHAMLEGHPERHTWGLGRHWVGSNYYYYLRDPSGNMTEYYSDMDEIVDDQMWEPTVFELHSAPRSWGPPAPPSFIEPDDLAELMAGLH